MLRSAWFSVIFTFMNLIGAALNLAYITGDFNLNTFVGIFSTGIFLLFLVDYGTQKS